MITYSYKAMDKNGTETEGTIEACTIADAVKQIREKQQFPTSIAPVETSPKSESLVRNKEDHYYIDEDDPWRVMCNNQEIKTCDTPSEARRIIKEHNCCNESKDGPISNPDDLPSFIKDMFGMK